MRIITTTEDLAALVAEYARYPFVTVDTEFMRERTYWPQLCLIQIARPGAEDGDDTDGDAAIIDPLAEDIDLGPLFELLANPQVMKVFHAARQDIEIFHHLGGVVPEPLFDTQVAAMVCGFGEQASYETLVRRIAKAELDKSSRFTDWSRRPLSQRQLEYALADVTHLRRIYRVLSRRLEESGRGHWVAEEMAILTDPATYAADPAEAWRRLRLRSQKPRFLAIVRELARWREETAQARDVPRSRVVKDDALLEVASARPRSEEDLSKLRLLPRDARRGEIAAQILAAVARGEACPDAECPRLPPPPVRRAGSGPVADLLKVLLKARAEELGVASKLIATASDLEALAGEENPDLPLLRGWRREAFGEDALKLVEGRLGLVARPGGVRVVELPAEAEAPRRRARR